MKRTKSLLLILTMLVVVGCASPAPKTESTVTPIIKNNIQPHTETPDVVLTAFANFPTPEIFPTSTVIMISLPTRKEVESANIPKLPIGNKGADICYISVPKDSIYLWEAVCFGKNAQDLQQNVSDMQITFRINDQVVDKSKILEFDRAFGASGIERTWAILISGWQINTTTKFEVVYSISQSLSENGAYTSKGDFYSIVYVNVQ